MPDLRPARVKGPPAPSRLAALLPMPFLAGPDGEALVLQVSVALLGFAALGLALLSLRQWRAVVRLRRTYEAERLRGGDLAAAIAAAPGGYWSWPAGDTAAPGMRGGALGHLFGVADAALGRFDDVLALLRHGDARQLAEALGRLHGEGAGFNFRVTTADGRRVLQARGLRAYGESEGRGSDTVWFRDITDAATEAARLMERVTALTGQVSGLRFVLDDLPVPVWVRGPDLALVYCNRAYARAVEEISPAAAVASDRELAGGPTGVGRRLAEEAVAQGTLCARAQYVVVEGQRRLFEIVEFPVGAEGTAWRVAGLAIDRHDADDTRTELDRHVAAHAEVLEKLGTGILVFGPDQRLDFFNAAATRMWGFDAEWLRGNPTHGEILEDLRERRMYPEQPDFQDYKRRRMELYTSLLSTQEELLHLPDERVIRLVISPHPLGGLMFVSEDVTDRITLERSYNTLIAVQSETLDNLHEAVAVFGADGRLKLFNPSYARVWRLDPDMLQSLPRIGEILDAAHDLFVYEGEWQEFRERLIASTSDRTARSGRFERADGSILDYSAVPLPDGAMLFSYIDVTDSVAVQRALRERNEALLTADRLKSEFITNVSYELRTPLNTIIGFAEILTNQYFGTLNRRQVEYTRGILEASQQLLALIDAILDLALIESGQLELALAPTDVRALLDSVGNLAREHARKRELSLEIDCGDDVGSFLADERRIKQAVFNLVSNSIKHTPPRGRIVVSARRTDGFVEIAVADTGAGIATEDQERVFGKFERAQGDESHGGLGIGLALVRSFVDMHGGGLALDSRPGEGTVVRMTLPAARA